MEKYGDNDFVIYDDIVKKNDMSVILEVRDRLFTNEETLTLAQSFNPSKAFRIECEVIFKSLHQGQNTGFILASSTRKNLASCKARVGMDNNSKFDSNTYWVNADQLGEHNFGQTEDGKLFSYIFEYEGDEKPPLVIANLESKGIQNMGLNPSNLSTSIISIGHESRNNDHSQDGTPVYFQKLIIYQD